MVASLLGTAIVLDSCGVCLTGLANLRHRLLGRRLIALACGILFGVFSVGRMDEMRRSCFTGIPLASITAFAGVLVQDSYLSSSGDTILKLDLRYVSSRYSGSSTDARGVALLVVNNGGSYSLGQWVAARARLSRRDARSREGYFARVSARNIEAGGFVGRFYQFRYRLKQSLEYRIEDMGHPAAELFKALFLGSREGLPTDLQDSFRRTGTLHVLAISGLHVGIIYLFVSVLLQPLPWRTLRLVVGTVLIVLYIFLVGLRPSLVRASLVLVLAGTGLLLDRDSAPLNLLAVALLVVVVVDPFSVYTLSFQLSFLAVFGILTIGRFVSSALAPFLPKALHLALAYSLGAQVLTAPLLVYHNGTVHPIAIVASALLVPVITLFLAGGMVMLLLSPARVAFLGDGSAWILGSLYRLLSFSTNLLARVPGVYLPVGSPAVGYVFGAGIVCVLFLPTVVARIRGGGYRV